MKRTAAALILVAASLGAWALPGVEAVQAEIRQGRYAEAETMMREVVAGKPGSARAHYVYAEILAHNGQLRQASSELQRARQLDPQLRFTDAAKVKAFEQRLDAALREDRVTPADTAASPSLSAPLPLPVPGTRQATPDTRAPAATATGTRSGSEGGGVPGWVWGLGGAGAALLLWRVLGARRQAPAGQADWSARPAPTGMSIGPVGASGGYGNGMPGMSPAPQAPGSGLAKAGLAAAGGFAAGILADRLLNGDHGSRDVDTRHDSASAGSGSGGSGLIPGAFDDVPGGSQQDFSSQPIDFGNGGDDWGGDSGGTDDNTGW